MKQLPLFLLCTAIVTGCAGKDYSIPDQPELMTQQQIESAYSVNHEWWKQYRDDGLNRCISLALERNIDLARSAITVNKALYRARQIGAELVPSFSSSASTNSRKQLDSGDSTRSYSASFGLSYELDLWGKLRESASAQSWEYQATELDREAARLALINTATNTWYSMAYTREALGISRETLKAYEKISAIMREQYQAGKSDRLNAEQAEQSVLAQRASILSLEEQLDQQQQTMRDLLDLRPGESLPAVPPSLSSVPLPSVDLEVPVSALGLRPDLKAAEYRIMSAFRSWQASRASLYPTVTIGGTIGASSNSQSSLFKTPFLNGLISLNLPFLDWNRVKWDIRISQDSFEDAKLSFRKALTSALNEVDRYHRDFIHALSQLDLAQKKHETDKRIESYRRTRYYEGADDLRYWLEAINTSHNSQMSALNAKFNAISAANALFEAQAAQLTSK
ncbi:MAG: TolC family protein [Mailhella sp.]|nr:TolC family protein [Mailhella sp.]